MANPTMQGNQSFYLFLLVLGSGRQALPAFAQITPLAPAVEKTVVLEEYVVQANAAPTANAIASAPQLKFQSPNTSVLNVIALLPGVNISQGDPFGGDDGSTRITIRGFDTDQLGYTVDGLPIGQTGYGGGTKPNRLIDAETLSSVVVSQGASDVASPSTQALGGTLAYTTVDPSKVPGGAVKYTTGSFDVNRVYVRGDSGLFADGQYGGQLHASGQGRHGHVQELLWRRHPSRKYDNG